MNNIKSSSIPINRANFSKKEKLAMFIADYKDAVIFYVNYLLDNKIETKLKDGRIIILDVKNDNLDCPTFLSTTNINYKTDLSARVLKSAITQSLGIVKSILEKRKKYLYIFNKLQSEHKRTRSITKKLNKTTIIKPNLDNIFPELNSLCCKYIENVNLKSFDNVMILSSLGKKYGKIIIPINHTKHSRKLEKQALGNNGKLMTSFLVTPKTIQLRYQISLPELKKDGIIVGADQGINTCITLSDHQTTRPCKHGHTLNSIIKKISRKQKGSKAFWQAKDHQKNYINWSVNQLNFSNIKEIRLEKISNFRYKKNVGKFLNYFGEKLIRDKLKDKAQQLGVLVVEQQSAYRSQRCSKCGYVDRKNRNGKNFRCKHCSFQADADLNASSNHEINLPSSENIRFLANKKSIKFFWKEEGFYDLQGKELTVPSTKKRF